MTETGAKPQREPENQPQLADDLDMAMEARVSRERFWERWRLLWLKRRLLFRSAIVGLVGAILMAFLLPKRYTSTVQLMPPDSQSNNAIAFISGLTGQSSTLSALAGDMLGLKSTGDLFVGVLRSRTVQDRIVERFGLKKEYRTRFVDRARKRLEQDTDITSDRKSGIIKVSVTDSTPKRAAEIAGAYIDELDLLMVQLNTSSAHRERIFLQDRLSAVKQELESAERDFGQFASKNATIDITAQGRAMVEATATLEGQLIAAESELQGLRQIYTDENVRVRSTQARISELQAQLQKLGGKPGEISPQNSDASAADPPGYPTFRQLPLLGIPYADKYRQFRVEEAAYEALTKEYELAKVEEAKEIPSVKVLDVPEVPEHRSSPPRLLIIFLGPFLAAGLSATWILSQTRWQAIAAEDPAKRLAQEVLNGMQLLIPWRTSDGSQNGGRAVEILGESESNDDRPRASQ
jgi:capsule polysaccharide export protein KpsE/RkpR